MLAVCSVCFAAEAPQQVDNFAPRVLRSCTTNPDVFIVEGKKDLTNTVINPKRWLCTVTDSETVMFTPVASIVREFQGCKQGPARITVSINSIPFTQLIQNTHTCIIDSMGNVSFIKK